MLKKLTTTTAILLLSACTSLSPNGANVMLVNTPMELPKNCNFIEYVEGAGAQDDLKSAFQVAEIRLRNEAGKINANHVVVTKKSEVFPLTGAIVGGKAYRCGLQG